MSHHDDPSVPCVWLVVQCRWDAERAVFVCRQAPDGAALHDEGPVCQLRRPENDRRGRAAAEEVADVQHPAAHVHPAQVHVRQAHPGQAGEVLHEGDSRGSWHCVQRHRVMHAGFRRCLDRAASGDVLVGRLPAMSWSGGFRRCVGRAAYGNVLVGRLTAMCWSGGLRQCVGRAAYGNVLAGRLPAMCGSVGFRHGAVYSGVPDPRGLGFESAYCSRDQRKSMFGNWRWRYGWCGGGRGRSVSLCVVACCSTRLSRGCSLCSPVFTPVSCDEISVLSCGGGGGQSGNTPSFLACSHFISFLQRLRLYIFSLFCRNVLAWRRCFKVTCSVYFCRVGGGAATSIWWWWWWWYFLPVDCQRHQLLFVTEIWLAEWLWLRKGCNRCA